MELDHLDWQIITLLNSDGRMPSSEIARRLEDISARTVQNRIDALVKNKIIHIRSIIIPEAVGYSVLADVFIETEPRMVREVAEALTEHDQISYLVCATGDTDIIISVRAKSIEELYDFVTGVVGKTPGVRHTQTYLLPLSIKDHMQWLPVEANESNSKPRD